MVRGLANKDSAAVVAARGETPFSSVDDLWRRAKVPVSSLVELADADAMKESLGLARREALWAIKALRDEPLELWSAAAVVEDYRHVGLSLRRHPVEFLRADLTDRRIVTCAEAMAARDGRWLEAAGLVLVRQRPGSAKGVIFITIEDETGVANLVVWPSLFERQRRAEMFGADGRGHITLLVRTILESENNGDALIEPIVSAVSICMRPEWTGLGLKWIETFDQIPLTAILETVRDLFGDHGLWQNYCRALRRKIAAILEPADAKPAKVKPAPKPPLSATRIPMIEKQISIGSELLAIRASIPGNTEFGRQVRKRFPGVDQNLASDCIRVARLYASRPQIWRALSWISLIELSSPKMAPSVRQAIEAKILAGESVTAPKIRRARGPLKGGSLKRKPDQLCSEQY